MNAPEPMSDFFRDRLEDYDRHMLEEVEGCRAAYRRMAELLPDGIARILDLGCGTGLELVPIFERFPHLVVGGIDLSGPMLAALRQRFPERWHDLCLVVGDFRRMKILGNHYYEAAVSFEAMHHLTKEEKAEVYKKIHEAITPGGVYLEGDYMLRDEGEAARLLAEAEEARRAHGIPEGEAVHLDIPLTVKTQIELLMTAGFSEVTEEFSEGNTVILRAKK